MAKNNMGTTLLIIGASFAAYEFLLKPKVSATPLPAANTLVVHPTNPLQSAVNTGSSLLSKGITALTNLFNSTPTQSPVLSNSDMNQIPSSLDLTGQDNDTIMPAAPSLDWETVPDLPGASALLNESSSGDGSMDPLGLNTDTVLAGVPGDLKKHLASKSKVSVLVRPKKGQPFIITKGMSSSPGGFNVTGATLNKIIDKAASLR